MDKTRHLKENSEYMWNGDLSLKETLQDKNQDTRVLYSQDIQSILKKLITFNIQVWIVQKRNYYLYSEFWILFTNENKKKTTKHSSAFSIS